MKNFKGYLDSLRPKTLTASVGPLILAFAICFKGNNPSGLQVLLMILLLLCTVLMQAGSNFANEYYDFKTGVDNHDRVGPIRSLQQGTLRPEDIKFAFMTCFLLAFLIGLSISWLTDVKILIAGIICLFVAWSYTGGPFPLSHFMLGEVFAFIFFGPVAVLGSQYVLVNEITWQAFLISLVPGTISALLMSVNNLRDWNSDRKQRKWTIASVCGQKSGMLLSLLFVCLSVLLPVYFIYSNLISFYGLLCILSFLLFFNTWKKIYLKRDLVEALGETGKYFFIHSLFLSIGVYLV